MTNDIIPDNCAIWFDGCNTCQISDKGNLCTKMMCMNQQPSECKRYYIPEELSADDNDRATVKAAERASETPGGVPGGPGLG